MTIEICDFEQDRRSVYLKQEGLRISRLTTADVDTSIEALGRVRPDMEPPIPSKWQRGQTVTCRRNPAWDFEASALGGELMLHLRDERYGWLHYVIDKETAGKMGLALLSIRTSGAAGDAGEGLDPWGAFAELLRSSSNSITAASSRGRSRRKRNC
jgi:hypothetical protein